MRYWWVNQNQTYREEVGGGFLWSPKRQSNNARNQFYDNMAEVSSGDVVFSFRASKISDVGVITGPAETGAKPDFATSPDNWSQDGWFVPVSYVKVPAPIRPKDHMALIGPLLPERYSPLQRNGNGLQQVYLAALSQELGELLIDLTGTDLAEVLASLEPDASAERDIAELVASRAVSLETDVEQLVRARRGQGTFRARVQQIETSCRVTGTATAAHLRASHIKPWRDSTNEERLDGANGLLLAPHVDHLFDRGWISFADDGKLLVSRHLEPGLLESWGITPYSNVGAFSVAQCAYLRHHRDRVFEHGVLEALAP